MTKITKKQHYVSRFYLKKWLSSRKKGKKGIWVENKKENKNYFCTNLNSISQIRYFYKLNIDQDVYDLLFLKYSDGSIYAKSFLREAEVLLFINNYQKNKCYDYEKLDILSKSFLENKYSDIENTIAKTLNFIHKNSSNLHKDNYISEIKFDFLIVLFSFQINRTERKRNDIMSFFHKLLIKRDEIKTELSDEQKENFIKSMLYIESMNMVKELLDRNFSIEILVSHSDVSFITSNTPAINVSPPGMKDLESFEGFMALTPKVAMILKKNEPVRRLTVTPISTDRVIKLNKVIYTDAKGDIYSIKK